MNKSSRYEQLADAEKRIVKAAERADASWQWAPYSTPSSGPPFLWNYIIVKFSNGDQEVREALDFVTEMGC